MFALNTQRLRRRLSIPTSGSARRRARERRRAERTRIEGERLARERREQRRIEKKEQQKKAREELASYEPWGRAGGGAPNPHGFRFTDLRSKGIYPEDELKGTQIFEEWRRWFEPKRRHPRTPLRLREDPQLFFAEQLKRAVDNDIRYRQTSDQQRMYKEILDEMVEKRKKALRDETRCNLEYERKMHAMDGPWGKPGPGGTIWRNPRNIGLNFSKSMGWTTNEIFNNLKREQRRYKGSSLTLPEVKRDDDFTELGTNKDNFNSSHYEKLPRIQKQSTVNNNNIRRTGKDDSTLNLNQLHTKQQSSKSKSVALNEVETAAYISIGSDSKNIIEKKLTPEGAILRLTGGIELVPLLARRRRVEARTLPSSDVTRPPEQNCQWREMVDVDHLSQLKHQMRVKREQKEESRRASAESVRRHHATWSSLWGRPGHGAPQQRGRYARNNLAQLLYVPRLIDRRTHN